jgi:hypothetical protein
MTARRSQSLAQLERDAALTRVSRVRRWTLVAAGALTAGFAALVSAIAPGHSLGAKTRGHAPLSARQAPRTGSRRSQLQMPPLASASDLGLQGPSSSPQAAPSSPAPSNQSQAAPPPAPVAPAPAPSQAPVVSGGS